MPALFDMFRPRSVVAGALLSGLLALPAAALAADLGPILIRSSATEPFQGELVLTLRPEESVDQLKVAVGGTMEYNWLEVQRPAWVDDVGVAIEQVDGQPHIKLWTSEVPPEQSFSLVLMVSSKLGRSLRQYDVALREAEVLRAPPTLPSPQPEEASEAATGTLSSFDASPAVAEQSLPVARPARRPVVVPNRGEPQVRRNLSISSSGSRLPAGALEKRAQRLEEGIASQQRALEEANSRIADLQSQVEKLQTLLALKGASPAAAAVAAQAAKPAEAAKPGEAPAKPAEPAAAAPAAPAAAPAAPATPTEAAPAVPGEATPPATENAAAAAEEQASADKEEAALLEPEKKPAPPAGDDISGLLIMVGVSVAVLLAATFGALWWRRRRARRQALLEAALAGGIVAEAPAPAAADTDMLAAAAEAPAEPAPAAPEPAEAAPAATAAVDEAFAAALDAPLGVAPAPAAAIPAAAPAATNLEALVAEPASPSPPPDDLDALFSNDAIAAAQAAIQTGVTAAAPPAVQVASPAPPPPPPAAAPALPDDEDEEEDEGDSAADLEDVEVNLAKAYIDMGDPEGARAILEGMLADTDNLERARLARRTMRRFGMQPSPPPAEA